MKKTLVLLSLFILLSFLFSGCQKEGAKAEFTIAVFIPGVVAGSPTYELLVKGVEKAVSSHSGASLKVVEGGFNQGAWEETVTSLASTESYDLIVTSNPAMPEICQNVSKKYPEQKFLILDGHLKGNPSIFTFRFNQMEQAFLAGHFAGLVTNSTLPGATNEHKVGLIVGQTYPDMDRAIRPGFELGIRTAVPDGTLDFRVVGNWYDAAKAAELARDMYDHGADIILTVAGGANQGVITAAKERGRYVSWFDINGYDIAPGVIAGSTEILLDRAAFEKTSLAIEGKLSYGNSEIGGVKEGYVRFVTDDPLYLSNMPEDVRKALSEIVVKIEKGELNLEMPLF